MKSIRTTAIQKKDIVSEIQKFLFAYCNSPQAKAPPANLMFDRKLNHLIPSKDNNVSTEQIEHLTQNQLQSKLKSRTYFNQKRHSQILNISKSSKFLIRQLKVNELKPQFLYHPYTVLTFNGTMLTS